MGVPSPTAPKYSPVFPNLTTYPGPNRGPNPLCAPLSTPMLSGAGTKIEMFVAKTNPRATRLTATNRVMHLSRSSQPLRRSLYTPSSLMLAIKKICGQGLIWMPRVRSQNDQVSVKTINRTSSATFLCASDFRRQRTSFHLLRCYTSKLESN